MCKKQCVTSSVKNLGVIFDDDNSVKQHVNKLCAICYYHIKDLRRIRRYLNADSAVLLANAMVSSNALLYGLNKFSVGQLQKVQNALCRMIFNLDRKCHVSPYLERLHWLPVHYRVLFKYNLLTYKALNLSQPPYLASPIKARPSARGKRLVSSHSAKNRMRLQFCLWCPQRVEQSSSKYPGSGLTSRV